MDYIQIVSKAIDYIEENIERDLTVFDVTQNAGYSPYHFSRIFHSTVGESLQSYIQKRKLYIASKELIYSDKKAIDIAFQCGYTSYEAFSRTFKSYFGSSPFYYRKQGLENYLKNKDKVDIPLLEHLSNALNLAPEIILLNELRVAGLHFSTPLKENNFSPFWTKFNKIKAEFIGHDTNKVRSFSICKNNHPTYNNQKKLYISQMLAFEMPLDNSNNLHDFLERATIPEGEYAVFTHIGSIDTIQKSYSFIWSIWLPNSNKKLDLTRMDFELYDKNFLGVNNVHSKTYIYIPVY